MTEIETRTAVEHNIKALIAAHGHNAVTPVFEQEVIIFLQNIGYRVTKIKPRKERAKKPLLNAIGKPYGPNYDPNYKIKTSPTSIARLYKPMGRFVQYVQS